MVNVYYSCQEDGRADVLFAYKKVEPNTYVWCVKGLANYGSPQVAWGFGLIRISEESDPELYGFEEIDYENTCSGQVYKYPCEGSAIDCLETDEDCEADEVDELEVSPDEMRALADCENILDDYYYTAEEDEDPNCGYFIVKEKLESHGDSFWNDDFDAWVYQAAKHVNQAGTHMELYPD